MNRNEAAAAADKMLRIIIIIKTWTLRSALGQLVGNLFPSVRSFYFFFFARCVHSPSFLLLRSFLPSFFSLSLSLSLSLFLGLTGKVGAECAGRVKVDVVARQGAAVHVRVTTLS